MKASDDSFLLCYFRHTNTHTDKRKIGREERKNYLVPQDPEQSQPLWRKNALQHQKHTHSIYHSLTIPQKSEHVHIEFTHIFRVYTRATRTALLIHTSWKSCLEREMCNFLPNHMIAIISRTLCSQWVFFLTSFEPAIISERLLGLLRFVPIFFKDRWTSNQKLPSFPLKA